MRHVINVSKEAGTEAIGHNARARDERGVSIWAMRAGELLKRRSEAEADFVTERDIGIARVKSHVIRVQND